MSIHSPQLYKSCVSSIHACWIYPHLRVTRVGTGHVESTCIRVLIECPKNDMAHVCCSCSVLKWHMQSNTHVRTAQALGNTCAPCAEFWDIRLTRDCMWFLIPGPLLLFHFQAMESWADPGDEARSRLPCNLGTTRSVNFGRPGNETTGLLNLQFKLPLFVWVWLRRLLSYYNSFSS